MAAEDPTLSLPGTVADTVAAAAPTAVGLPVLPGYEVVRELGRGGMGVVYEARQAVPARTVAVKMLLDDSPEARQRFVGEANAAARLAHPHIVPIYEVGEANGRPYLTQEYLAGGSLADRLRDGPLPPREAAAVVRVLAGAMQHAHAAGVVHRDLKPANVLVAADGTLKVSDFGLAKKLDEAGQTQTGAILGTPSYMAPEQAAGGDIGPAADVWALGAILYCLTTGRPPFQAASAVETVLQVLHADPVAVRSLNPAVPRDLETIALKCLRKEPGQRYASAAALADDLGRWLDGRPIVARPVGTLERAGKWVRRRPALAAALAGIVLAVAAGLTGVLLAYGEAVRERNRALGAEAATAAQERQTARERDRALDAERDARRQLARAQAAGYALQIRQAQADLAAGNPAGAAAVLAGTPWDLRGWEYHHLRAGLDRERGTVREGIGDNSPLAVAPDGRAFAVAARDGLQVWGRDGERPRLLAGAFGRWRGLAWSPDGKHLAAGGEKEDAVFVHDAATGERLGAWPGHANQVRGLAYSPDGATLASAGLDGSVRLWDAASGRPGRVLDGRQTPYARVAWTDAGTLVALGLNGSLERWDAGGELLGSVPTGQGLAHDLAVGPRGRLLAVGGGDGSVKVFDAATLAEVWSAAAHRKEVWAVAFAPDGRAVASAGEDKVVRLWEAATGRPLLSAPVDDVVYDLAFLPDGGTLLAGLRTHGVARLDVRVGLEATTLRGHTNAVQDLAYAPDGVRLATASSDGTVRLWDSATGLELASARVGKVAAALAWRPDGVLLVADDTGAIATLDGTTLKRQALWEAEREPAETLVASPDGRWLAVLGRNRSLVRDAYTGAILWQERDKVEHHAAAFAPRGGLLALGSSDHRIRLLRAGTWEPAGVLAGHDEEVRSLAWSPDGATLASGSTDKAAILWDVAAGQPAHVLRGHTSYPWALAWSPSGRRLATGGWDGTLRLWDPATGQALATFPLGKTWPHTLAWRPDGRQIAFHGSTTIDPTAHLWAVADEPDRRVLSGPTAAVNALAVAPDEQTLATGGADRVVRLWDLPSGRELRALRGHTGPVLGVGYSADGTRLLSVAAGELLAWDAASGRRVPPGEGDTPPARGVEQVTTTTGEVIEIDGRTVRLRVPTTPGRRAGQAQAEAAAWLRWHLREAADAVRAGDDYAARWHRERLVERDPARAALYRAGE